MAAHRPNQVRRKTRITTRSSSRSTTRHVTQLIYQVCCSAGSHSLVDDIRSEGVPNNLASMIERRDTPAIFDWLIVALSYQGISDGAASAYIEKNGSVTWREISRQLSKGPTCPKLANYWNFEGCSYNKTNSTCNQPQHYPCCPLPKHRLRNGRLNQTAYSLFLFIRDIAGSDLVSWIESILNKGANDRHRDRLSRMRAALLGRLRHIYGASDKVLSLAFASILLAAPTAYKRWAETGGSMIAVDTLVHNFLHRTGILWALKSEHPYGPRCYGENGCAQLIERIAHRINARKFNRTFPRTFPRFVQYAIWRYCAQDALNVCNGNRIDDQSRCKTKWCSLYALCDRQKLRN